MTRPRFTAALIAVAVVLAARPLFAAPVCRIAGSSNVAFGVYNPLSPSPTDSTGSISYSCPGALSPVITISTGVAGSFAPRHMATFGPDVLQYNLYVDAARTTVWGDGTGGTSTVNGTAGGGGATQTIYARAFAQQNVAGGPYGDMVTVTINF